MDENYPISSEAHDQERKSRLKFESVVPSDLFIVRTESGGDYGTDIILEAKSKSKFLTNFRVHVQLKSEKMSTFNEDDTLSYPVPIKTLNYLLNHAPSIFVIYIENKDQFYWAWTTDIFRQAEQNGVDITKTEQKTISYRFPNDLTLSSFREIHQKVFSYGQVNRQLSEIYSQTVTPAQIEASINLTNGKVITLQEKIELLKKGAVPLANSGRIDVVDALIATLSKNAKKDHKLALAVSYVKFLSGQFAEAYTWLPRGQQPSQFSDEDRQLFDHLEALMQYNMRIINKAKLGEKIRENRNRYSGTIISLLSEFEEIRNELLRSPEWAKEEPLKRLAEILDKIRQHQRCGPHLRLQLEIGAWEVAGLNLVFNYTHMAFTRLIRDRIKLPIPQHGRLDLFLRLSSSFASWLETGKSLQSAAASQANRHLYYSVGVAKAHVLLMFISESRAIRNASGSEAKQSEDASALEQLVAELDLAFVELMGSKYFDLGLRARVLQAEALIGLNQRKEAQNVMEEVVRVATELGNNSVLDLARLVEDGNDIFSQIGRMIAERETLSTDDLVMRLSETDMSRISEDIVFTLGLPSDRLGNVLKAQLWLKQDVTDRLKYCKYLDTLEHLQHGKSLETLYKTDPLRRFHCTKKGSESKIPGTDRDSLLLAFQKTYCVGCKDQIPRQTANVKN
jgi:hypothetical protein